MPIYMGGSCVGYGNTTLDTTVNEIRFVQSERHHPIDWNTVDMSLANRIKMIINIDSYGDGSNRGWHNEVNLRSFTEEIIRELLRRAYNSNISHSYLKKFCRLTFDNEANEIYSPASYCIYLDIFYSQVKGRFDVGAGNFGNDKKDYYLYLLDHRKSFEVLDIHLQNGFETLTKIDQNIGWYGRMAKQYGKRISCTEANDTNNNLWSDYGYRILTHQLEELKKIDGEDFCMVFIKLDKDKESYRKISFNYHGEINPNWSKFKRLINDNRPAPIPNIIEPIIISEDDDMKLKLLGLAYTKKGQQVKWLQDILLNDYKVPNPGGIDGKLGSMTDKQIRDYQEEKELKVDGIVGEQTTMKLINESSDPRKWIINLQVYMAYE